MKLFCASPRSLDTCGPLPSVVLYVSDMSYDSVRFELSGRDVQHDSSINCSITEFSGSEQSICCAGLAQRNHAEIYPVSSGNFGNNLLPDLADRLKHLFAKVSF